MAEERLKERVVPASTFDFATERSRVGMGTENVEVYLAQHCEVLRSMVLAVAGAIFVEDHVEDPVELVLNRGVDPIS